MQQQAKALEEPQPVQPAAEGQQQAEHVDAAGEAAIPKGIA
jgi:hypothetical protein